MPVTMQDIARKLGVSGATVSRVLNGRCDALISAATRQRVLTTAAELGYQPNRAARALRTGQTRVIGLWLMELHSPFVTMLQEVLNGLLETSGYDTMLCNAMPRPDDLNAHVDRVAQWPVDGIITSVPWRVVEKLRERHPERHIPMAVLNHSTAKDVDNVQLDHRPGTVEALTHLLQQGRRRVAFLTPKEAVYPGDPRLVTYNAAMANAGLEPQVIQAKRNQRAAGYEIITSTWREAVRPDALFCFNDDLAIGAMAALKDLGCRVPEDVAVVGCDGLPETAFLRPRLSTLVTPTEEMGRLVWTFLQRRLAEPHAPPQTAVLEPKLEIHESS
jgi:LacI family transcriptional regulator